MITGERGEKRKEKKKLTTIGRNVILQHVETSVGSIQIVLLAGKHLVHLGAPLFTRLRVQSFVAGVSHDTEHEMARGRSALVGKQAQVAIKGTVHLDESHIPVTIVAALHPLGRRDNGLGQAELNRGQGHAVGTLVANEALDLLGLAVAVPVEDVVAGRHHEIWLDEPAGAHGVALFLAALVGNDKLDDGCVFWLAKIGDKKKAGYLHRYLPPSAKSRGSTRERRSGDMTDSVVSSTRKLSVPE